MNREQKKTIKKLYAVMITVLIAFMLAALYALIFNFFTVAKADSPRVKGEFILFVTMQNGPAEETLFGGSFPNNQACLAYAYQNYPIDGRRWIAYKCIHEDVHEYLESKKGKGLDI